MAAGPHDNKVVDLPVEEREVVPSQKESCKEMARAPGEYDTYLSEKESLRI